MTPAAQIAPFATASRPLPAIRCDMYLSSAGAAPALSLSGSGFELAFDPAADHADDILPLLRRQLLPGLDPVVSVEARPAAGTRCVLGDEDGVAAVRGLLPVLDRESRGEALADQVVRVAAQALGAVELS